MNKFLITAFVYTLVLVSCKKESEDTMVKGNEGIPTTFDFATSSEVSLNLSVQDLQGAALKGIRLDVFDKDPIEGGTLIHSLFTDANGSASGVLQVASYQETVFVQCNYIGFANTSTVLTKNDITLSFGGVPEERKGTKSVQGTLTRTPAGGNVYYIGSFDDKGLPDYLENPGDVIATDLLSDVNSALPERQPVPTNNSDYLASNNTLDVVVTDKSDVWVTFITEGAGYKNSLAYYVYDSSNPPISPTQIDSIFLVFPNASLNGSGGSLRAGDKVKLGTFEAGKTISWVLFQDAWDNNTESVNVNKLKVYSNAAFNQLESGNNNQQTVQLVDQNRELFINGFEDISRNSSSSDQDFNDCIFYVTANPWVAITSGKYPGIVPDIDSDNDGVYDIQDDYPNDPARACDVQYIGALGFEDLWPAQGDYDFNDLVVDYDILHVLNSSNEVVELKMDWTIKAVGAGYNNGFGFEFPDLAPSSVSAVSGSSLTGGLVSTLGNGTEAGQTNATVIAWDQTFSQIQNNGGAFINTVSSDPQVTPVTKNMIVSFATPQQAVNVGLPPYNPFIFTNETRSIEVHLSDKEPTALADVTLFGTVDDNSNPSANRYYKNESNLPWAIHIYGSYDYAQEYIPINEAHLNFSTWASSGGVSFPDWYLDLSGYRNSEKIY